LTLQLQSAFKEFGSVLDLDDHFELEPAAGFTLSKFFSRMEECGVKYRWIELKRPTIEALFLHLTGRKLRD
jgi:ABC-2 type transport system ATP-binding protein